MTKPVAKPETRPAIKIGHNERDNRGRYWMVTSAGEAELVYSLGEDDKMIINSTFVPIDARGGGVALALVTRAVEDARATGRKVDPVCPYVDRVFGRHPEWRELRA
ncbi:MAG: hypothetical protein A3E78_01740 [Alphaproteobacteria bacterium RIFCSPHIGHO2_12_FULL_63_12]|nr:MAG: hypothetical protein A3E78_01740 [Alphaproteobacteria bacterium RIFCSPHIGHO2_12_FULL_63_12]